MSRKTTTQRWGLWLGAAIAGCAAAPADAPDPDADTLAAGAALASGTPADLSISPLATPAGVERMFGGFWLEEGKIVAGVRYQGESEADIGVIDLASGALHCLTCGLDLGDLGRPQPFADGKRLLVQSPSNSNHLGDFSHWIVTCAPSLADCQQASAEPVHGLAGGAASLQERWPAISPDGAHIAWTRLSVLGYRMLFADLVHSGGAYEASDIRVLNPASDLGSVEGLIDAAAWYEIKGFTEDGQGLLVGSTRGGTLNLDAFVLDLATGAWERLTRDPDWDEDHEISPDGSWFLVGSARGEDTLTPFSLVPLPPLLDFGIVAPVLYHHIGGDARRSGRRHIWRFPRQSDAGQGGQLLAPGLDSGKVLSSGPELSADGTSLLFGERVPQEADRQLLVGTFDAPPLPPAAHQPTPAPAWAPLLAGAPALPASFSAAVPGPAGGKARVRWLGGVAGGSFSVHYQGYTTEQGLVLDGSQSFEGAAILGRYRADITVSGSAQGSAAADLWIAGAERCGHAEASLDGRHAETDHDCQLCDLP